MSSLRPTLLTEQTAEARGKAWRRASSHWPRVSRGTKSALDRHNTTGTPSEASCAQSPPFGVTRGLGPGLGLGLGLGSVLGLGLGLGLGFGLGSVLGLGLGLGLEFGLESVLGLGLGLGFGHPMVSSG
jgi:hypothetical protein